MTREWPNTRTPWQESTPVWLRAAWLRDACPRWKADDGKTYEYNPFLHSYREVDEHREMVAADLFDQRVRQEAADD